VLKNKPWFTFVPATIWCVLIIVGSFMPSSNVPKMAVSDKGIHFAFYAILALLIALPLRTNTKTAYSFVSVFVAVLVIGFSLGAVIELVQHYYITGRFGEYLDLLANTIGLVAGLLVSEIIKRKVVL
jgi:VanZ family protein